MKYLILQNTIAPYRNSLFNKMVEMGLDIELLYMCEREKERSWNIDYSSMHFPYVVDDKPYHSVFGIPMHWNPKLICIMRRAKHSKIIMGSPWNSPDVVAACILKRLGLLKSEIIFWSEANYLTLGSQKKNSFRDWLRKFVYNSGEGRIIVPGHMAVETFSRWGFQGKDFIQLPNVIDEDTIFPLIKSKPISKARSEQPRFVMPVRLNEKVKGIINFFKAIGKNNILTSQFEILGDGSDYNLINSWIKEHNFEQNIHLRGFCSMQSVVEFYNECDCFILPSFSDPSPLSIVEACCCGMPLLISTRCGNHYETLEEGVNGYSFDPDNANQIKKAFESMIAHREDWSRMGQKSRLLFETNFKQDVVIKHFIESLSLE